MPSAESCAGRAPTTCLTPNSPSSQVNTLNERLEADRMASVTAAAAPPRVLGPGGHK